jgi:hypothetical protein
MAKSEQIRVDIVSTDDASQVLDEVADKAEALEKLEPEVAVTADDQATATVEQVDALVAELDKREPEVTVTADTSAAETDLDAVADAAKAAADLKPEVTVTAKTGAAKTDLGEVGDKADALSRADYEIVLSAKVEQARADLKRAEESLDKVRGATKGIGTDADQSRSVMANFAGNVTSELPGVAGAFGPLNMAVGQFAEYAAEGNINMANFIKTAGGMAVITGAVMAINSELKEIAAGKAFDKAQVDAFADSVLKGEDAVTALAERLTEAGKVEFDLFGEGVKLNVVDALVAAGLTVEEFAQLVIDGKPAIDAWAEAQRDAGTDTNDIAKVVGAATEQTENYSKGLDAAKVSAEFFGTAETDAALAVGYVASSAEAGAENIAAMQSAHEADVKAAEDHAAALEAEADKLLGMADAARGAVDAGFALRDAQRKAKETATNVNTVLETEGTTMDDLAVALDDAAEAALDVADATVRQREETRKARGQTVSATDKIDIMNDSLLEQAANARGPLRDALIAHIGKLNEIPAKKASEIQALIDAGKLQQAKDKLADASKTRTATVTADAKTADAEKELNDVARDRDVLLNVSAQYPSGFITLPGGAVIPGPQAVGPPIPGRLPAPTELVNVTVNLPRGHRELDVVAAARRAARRSGGLYRRTRR